MMACSLAPYNSRWRTEEFWLLAMTNDAYRIALLTELSNRTGFAQRMHFTCIAVFSYHCCMQYVLTYDQWIHLTCVQHVLTYSQWMHLMCDPYVIIHNQWTHLMCVPYVLIHDQCIHLMCLACVLICNQCTHAMRVSYVHIYNQCCTLCV
jgi:hypothetical protein